MKKPVSAGVRVLIGCLGIFFIGVLDLITGYELNFFVFYFLPVSYIGWHLGIDAALVLSLLSTIVWVAADYLSNNQYSSHLFAVWNATVRLVAFVSIGWSVSRMRKASDREKTVAADLRKALSEVKVLETFLPVCAECKKIRNKDGMWQHMEVYIGEHSNTIFSHGYCPECAKKALEEADQFLKNMD